MERYVTGHKNSVFRGFSRFVFIFFALFLGLERGSAQTVSYILPDIGTPDLNTYVEFIGPASATGNFGTDGFYLNQDGEPVRVVCANPADSSKIVVGPIVVSWSGRMISTQVFVHPSLQPNSQDWNSLDPQYIVGLQVIVNGIPGNVSLFYIVRPGSSINVTGGGAIGGGGTMGVRSPRGGIIVESINLGDGLYTIYSGDPDPSVESNQGYLPATVISKGPVRGTGNARISVDGGRLDAGPGGGGGGGAFCDVTGDGSRGGAGFTGGGRGGKNGSGVFANSYQSPGGGTGPYINNTGASLNGVLGGTAPWYEAAGGGTGHPFGISGEGCASGDNCDPVGGYGGGSGYRQDQDGGAGGYATPGEGSSANNGGKVHGNMELVPLAGGSGGAGGNPQGISQCSGEAGGGGGALRIFGASIVSVQLTADGGSGQTLFEADGAGGSGGAVIAESKLNTSPIRISAAGGGGGTIGGAGRLRVDGPAGTIQQVPAGASFYRGISTDTSHFVARNFTLTGTGNGNNIHIYIKPENEQWRELAEISGYSGGAWSLPVNLPGNQTLYYLTAVQTVSNPNSAPLTAEPAFVFSQAAANILHYSPVPRIAADTTLQFSTIRCDTTITDTLYVRNEGDGDLTLSSAQFGAAEFSLLEPALPAVVAPGDSVRLVIRFTSSTAGVFFTDLLLANNDTATARNPFRIHLRAVKEVAAFIADPSRLFLGTIACTGFVDTTITLRNPTDTDILILEPVFSNSTTALISPPATSFPILVANRNSRDIRVRIAPRKTGLDSVLVTFNSTTEFCDVRQTMTIVWDYEDVSYSIDTSAMFRTTYCMSETRDTTYTVTNTGTTPVTFNFVGITAPFTVLSPSFPLTLNPGESRAITVRFTSASSGFITGQLTLNVQPCNETIPINLYARSEFVELSANDISFGIRQPGDLPMRMYVTVKSISSTPVTLTSGSLSFPTPFRVTGGLPATIVPGDSARIEVEFMDPGKDTSVVVELTINHTPTCNPLIVKIMGGRGEASVVLEIGKVSGGTGDHITIPVYLRNAKNLSLHGASAISTTLRLDASILYPQGATPLGTIINGERVIPLSVPLLTDANEVALRLPFVSMLGTAERTDIVPENSVGVNGAIAITELPGSFTLTDICRQGGTRLFDGSRAMQLAQNSPNPFNAVTRIEYSVIESGLVTLEVFDRLGRTVRTLVHEAKQPGTYSTVFDAADLPSGIYRYVLRTQTMSATRSMILAK